MNNNLRQLRQMRFQFFFHLNLPTSKELKSNLTKEVLNSEYQDFLNGEEFDISQKQKDDAFNFCFDNLSKYEQMIEYVEKYSKKWKVERLSKVDLTLIVMAFYELKFISTPFKVVINESVELAKIFGTKESPQFVNGILDKFYKEEIKSD